MKDELGDRMKVYEEAGERRMMPLVPVFARVDGKSFHSFTRGLKRPYDETMAECMLNTALFLARETNANMTYTQSDEITLCWLSNDPKSQIWFDGRHSKMVSCLAALATLEFNAQVRFRMTDEYQQKRPIFDCRVWCVPTRPEGANVFLWREMDATKNSISMAAHSVFSPKQVHGKTGSQKQEMLFAHGINWNDYPAYFKRGVFVQRRKVVKPFSADEIENLPPLHSARTNPNLLVERQEWESVEMPRFRSVANREAVIFDGATPVKLTEPTTAPPAELLRNP